MTEVLQKLVVDCSTGEATYVPLTAEEIAQREADAIAYAEQKAIQDAADAKKASDRAAGIATLKSLGLTDDQIAALIG